jgi:DNA processing protein
LLFPDPKQVICDVFKNNHNKYRSVFNLKPVTKTECFEALKLFGRQQQMGIKAISYLDKEYPFNLEKIVDAPILIYRKGYTKEKGCKAPLLAIVGTRKMTTYGKRQIDEFFNSAQKSEFDVISGLAYGVDSYAQSVASDYGFTVHSVLAHGLDHTYPRSNATLLKKLEQNGYTYSEYAVESAAHKGRFLARNRLIAAMADVVWVVESAEKGGSLFTDDYAKGYNSYLIASPGDIHREASQGCNRLIANHSAALYERPETIATHLGIVFSLTQESLSKKAPNDRKSIKIYELLKYYRKLYPSQIIQLSGLDKSTVLELLLKMNLENQISQNPDNSYSV